MTGQQTAFRFSDKKGKSAPEGASRKRNTHKRTKEKGQPERKGKHRNRRAEPMRPKTAEKAVTQAETIKVAGITVPVRLSVSEHAEWREFAKHNRFSLHQFVKNSVEDVLSRLRQGKSISWIELG